MAAIYNTVDLDTGQSLASFTKTVPAGDIAVGAGNVAVRGNMNFP